MPDSVEIRFIPRDEVYRESSDSCGEYRYIRERDGDRTPINDSSRAKKKKHTIIEETMFE